MEIKQKNIYAGALQEENVLLKLPGNPLVTKKRDIPKSERPKMYLQVQELLAGVHSQFYNEIIAGR